MLQSQPGPLKTDSTSTMVPTLAGRLEIDNQLFIKILTNRATGKRYKHKVKIDNKSVLQITHNQVNIVIDLGKYTMKMKSQLCALAA